MPRDLTTASDARLRARARTLAFEVEAETRSGGAPTAATAAELVRLERELERRAYDRAERAIARLSERGLATDAVRLLRRWDRGEIDSTETFELARDLDLRSRAA